jgi:diguanylate cyclase (GGDEF)-like protein
MAMSTRALIFSHQPEQEHRIQRFLIGVGSSVLVWAVMFLIYSQGHMEATGLVRAGLAMLFLFVAFYTLFRTRVNLRAADQSLTAPQILSSIVVTLYAMYYTTNAARTVLSMVFIMAFFFGVFRLNTRQFAMIAVITLAGYVVLIGMLLRYRPETIDVNLEFMRCAATGVVLFWFSMVGGYVGRLRKRLAISKTRLEKAIRTIKQEADTDELTGGHNRRYLMDMLQRERSLNRRTGSTFCVCIADVDHFKRINDAFGHHTGDEVLRGIVRAAHQWLRVTDYFGRYGGDELMVILTNASIEGARTCAEMMRRQIEQLSFPDLDPNVRVTLSIGVTQYRPGEDVADTVHRADLALYAAKQAGRNRVLLADEPKA